jgi:hypothetical protein
MLLNRLNYFNQINRINNNSNKINSDDLYDTNFIIDIPQILLTKIEKKYLIDLILFIQKYCNLKIIDKFLKYQHDIYEIRIYKNNQCSINIKDYEKKKIEKKEKEEEDIKEENKNKIISLDEDLENKKFSNNKADFFF